MCRNNRTPKSKQISGAKIATVMIDDYAYLIPYMQENDEIFLKNHNTSSRKSYKQIREVTKMKKTILNDEEKRYFRVI